MALFKQNFLGNHIRNKISLKENSYHFDFIASSPSNKKVQQFKTTQEFKFSWNMQSLSSEATKRKNKVRVQVPDQRIMKALIQQSFEDYNKEHSLKDSQNNKLKNSSLHQDNRHHLNNFIQKSIIDFESSINSYGNVSSNMKQHTASSLIPKSIIQKQNLKKCVGQDRPKHDLTNKIKEVKPKTAFTERFSQLQADCKIADEKNDSNYKQAIIQTPKFTQCFTMQDKNKILQKKKQLNNPHPSKNKTSITQKSTNPCKNSTQRIQGIFYSQGTNNMSQEDSIRNFSSKQSMKGKPLQQKVIKLKKQHIKFQKDQRCSYNESQIVKATQMEGCPKRLFRDHHQKSMKELLMMKSPKINQKEEQVGMSPSSMDQEEQSLLKQNSHDQTTQIYSAKKKAENRAKNYSINMILSSFNDKNNKIHRNSQRVTLLPTKQPNIDQDEELRTSRLKDRIQDFLISKKKASLESPSQNIFNSMGRSSEISSFRDNCSQIKQNVVKKHSSHKKSSRSHHYAKQEILQMTVNLSEESFAQISPKENVSSELHSIDFTDQNLEQQKQNIQELQIKTTFISEQAIHLRQMGFNSRLTCRSLTLPRLNEIILKDEIVLASLFSFLLTEDLMKLYYVFYQKSLRQFLTLAQKVIFKSFQFEHQIKSFWLRYFHIITKKHQLKPLYERYSKLNSLFETDIENDIERTYLSDQDFACQEKHQQLFRILRAASQDMPQLGYIQGFNFIGARLLMFLKDEEQAFYTFTSILKQKSAQSIYLDNLSGLKLLNFQLNCYIQNLFPDVDLYFTSQGLNCDLFFAQWIITFFSLDFNSDFFVKVMNLFILFGQEILLKVCLSMIEQVKDKIMKMDVESAINLLKEGFRDEHLNIDIVLERAIDFKEVNTFMMKKLEDIYRNTKTRRVLFIKDQDSNQILIKELPQLPDEYYTTEENAEEDYESDFQSLTKGKRQIKTSLCLNNVTALEIKAFPDFEYDEFSTNRDHIQAPKTSRDSNQKNKFNFFKEDSSNIPSPIQNTASNSSSRKEQLTCIQFNRTQHIFQENKANKPQNTCEIRRRSNAQYIDKISENFDPNQAVENIIPDNQNLRKRFKDFKNSTMKFQENIHTQPSYDSNVIFSSTTHVQKLLKDCIQSETQPDKVLKLSETQILIGKKVPQISSYKQAMSPKNTQFNKQSQKINLHVGDLLSDDGDHTTLITPKESLVLSRSSNASYIN